MSRPTTSRGDVRSDRERPEPSTIVGASSSSASSSSITACARRGAAGPAEAVAQHLDQHLGHEVVRRLVHLPQQHGQRLGPPGADRHGRPRGAARPRRRGRRRRRRRAAAWRTGRRRSSRAGSASRARAAPVRPRLNVSAESGPTSDVRRNARGGHAAARVERRLVAEHAARDRHDAGVGDLLGEAVGVEQVEGRVAAAAQVEVAVDDPGGVRRRLGQHGGAQAAAGPEPPQGRRRGVELLHRGGHPRRAGAQGVDLLARVEVHDERAGAGPGRRASACRAAARWRCVTPPRRRRGRAASRRQASAAIRTMRGIEGREPAGAPKVARPVATGTSRTMVRAWARSSSWRAARDSARAGARKPRGRPVRSKTALVLGGGGFTGAVYEIGALRALDLLSVNRSVNQFDVYVGTSAGCARRGADRERRDARADDAGRQQPGADAVPRHQPGHAAAAELPRVRVQGRASSRSTCWASRATLATQRALVQPGRPRRRRWPRRCPSGLYSGSGLEEYVRTVLTDPDRTDDFRLLDCELYLAATDLDTCERLVLGAEGWDDVPISTAVRASAALPMVYQPVEVRGRELIDGGIVSTTNLDIAVEAGAKFIVVVNPLVPYVNDFTKRDPHAARHQGAPGLGHGLPEDRLPDVQAARLPAPARDGAPVAGPLPGRRHRADRARARRRDDVPDEHPQLRVAARTSRATASSR